MLLVQRTRSSMRRVLAGLALASALAAPAASETFTPPQREEIGRVIKEYLLKNPEVLQDAMNELQRRTAESERAAQTAAIRELNDTLLRSQHGNVVGNPTGDVTLVEFFDYNCGYCKQALTDVQTLLKADPKLRVVLKDLPVLGPDSIEASRVALAVKQQISGDKLFDYHARLIGTRGRIGADRATAVAREMGLDIGRLQKDIAGPEVRAALDENRTLGERLGVNGTPAFVIGEEVISGAVGAGPLRQAVAGMRKCGHVVC